MEVPYTPVEETSIPREAIFRGRRVRVIGYIPASEGVPWDRFIVIDRGDLTRTLSRKFLSFPKFRKELAK
jgi:hypothetical protein